MLANFLESVQQGNMIAPKLMAAELRVPMTELAKLAGVNRNTLSTKAGSTAVQAGLGMIARIIERAAQLAGDEGRAIIWFRHQPIVGFGGKTAEELVEDGHAEAVLWHLESLENGVYA
jgi:uncharacterized protein (DUF2384 family)